VRIGVVVLVLAALLVAVRVYADQQWYVGVDDAGHVAVFQGIPATVGPFSFSHVAVSSDLGAARAEALPLYADLGSGITADSRDEALAILQQIQQDLAASQSSGHQGGGASPSPSRSPGGTG
jgi:protein phosphatase